MKPTNIYAKACMIGLSLMLLFSVLAAQTTVIVYADDTYYSTWSAYKEAGNPASVWNDVADAMDAVFDKAIEYFEAGDMTSAYNCVNDGYYGYYETTGFERVAMGYISGSRKTEVELQFAACKAVTKNNGTLDEFTEEIDTLKAMIHKDANVLDGVSDDDDSSSSSSSGTSAAYATFIACYGIMLREGFEAILIVGAIIAYLNKAAEDEEDRKKKTRPVYIGSIAGIILSFGLAALLNAIKLANTASQEIIEGVTALIAVCVLYYVSNWMLSKSETDAWNAYIKEKVEVSEKKGSLFALAFTAFLAVFREGAEVVLFFQPMLSGDNINMVWTGFFLGAFSLVFVYIAIHVMSVRIPLKPFFTGTSILMFAMSISFLGAGIKELIEGDLIVMTSPKWLQWIPSNDLMDVLGIYPVLQTLIPQLLLLVVTIVIFVRTTIKNNKIHAEAEAVRAEERRIEEERIAKEEEEAFEAKVRAIVEKVLAEKQGAKPAKAKAKADK